MIISKKYTILGPSKCCQHLQIYSNGKATEVKGITTIMGNYNYYGDDPDGARIYQHDIHNWFISRNHMLAIWQVSQIFL